MDNKGVTNQNPQTTSGTHQGGDGRNGSDSGARTGRPAPGTNDLPGTQGQHMDRRPEGTDYQEMPGRNTAGAGDAPEGEGHTAFSVKEANREMSDRFTDDELKQIPIIPEGQRLAQGATYYNLRNPGGGAFTARGDESAGRDAWIVPKRAVEAQLWNRLTGVANPERRGEASEA